MAQVGNLWGKKRQSTVNGLGWAGAEAGQGSNITCGSGKNADVVRATCADAACKRPEGGKFPVQTGSYPIGQNLGLWEKSRRGRDHRRAG